MMSLPIYRSITNAYDIYSKEAVADYIESGLIEEYFPRNDIRSNTLEFVIDGNSEHAIVPRRIALKLTLELSGHDGTAAEGTRKTVVKGTAQVAPINNIFHSIFENVSVYVSNQAITKVDNNYPYIAYLQMLTNLGKDSLDTNYQLTGWVKDDSTNMESRETNSFNRRNELFTDNAGDKTQFIGRLMSPIFTQDKILPTQVSMTIRLQKKADKKFYLLHEKSGQYELKILAASLLVQKVILTPMYKESIRKMLSDGTPIPYRLNVPSINYMTIEPQSTQFIRDNLFLGKTPHRIIIGLVETEAYQGHSEKNPFNFQHFDLSQIALYKDGVPFPRPITHLNFTTGQYSEAYYNLMVSFRGDESRFVPYITRDDFGNGFALYSYDMSPDQMGSTTYSSLANTVSNIRLELKFATPTPKNITLIAYCERKHLLEIHEDRRVNIDL